MTNTLRKCSRCLEEKSITEFCKDVRRKDGINIYCKLCEHIRRVDYYTKHKAREDAKKKIWIAANRDRVRTTSTACHKRKRAKIKTELAMLLGGACMICGYSKCVQALDFHHYDDTIKSFNISMAIQWKEPWENLIEEIRKCVLLCSNCHREVHYHITVCPSPGQYSLGNSATCTVLPLPTSVGATQIETLPSGKARNGKSVKGMG